MYHACTPVGSPLSVQNENSIYPTFTYMIHSYGAVRHWNDLRMKYLLEEIVVIEEKLDGWQVSFGVMEDFEGQRQLALRTKNTIQEHPDIWEPLQPLWDRLETIQSLLKPGWTYRGEYLPERKMHKITYDRPASGLVVIWDIDRGAEDYLQPRQKRDEAMRLGFDVVQPLAVGKFKPSDIPKLVPDHSMLGGRTEGVVIKNYRRNYKNRMMKAKYVRPEFRD